MTSSTGCSGLTRSGLPPRSREAVAHRGEIDDARHAGEVLEQDARRHERDLTLGRLAQIPLSERADIVGTDERAVLAPQQVLEQDLQRERQPLDTRESRLGEGGQAEVIGDRRARR